MKDQNLVLILVMAVPLIVWCGVFAYLMNVDRTLRRLERAEQEQDQL
jgi:CcmD family protein